MTEPSPFSTALHALCGGCSATDLARAANVHVGSIYNYLKGATLPEWRAVARMGTVAKADVAPLRPLWEDALRQRTIARRERARLAAKAGGAK